MKLQIENPVFNENLRADMGKNRSLNNEKSETELSKFFRENFRRVQKIPLKEFIENLEREIIVKVLTLFNGNQKESAKFLGIKYTTLNAKVKKYNIVFEKKPL